MNFSDKNGPTNKMKRSVSVLKNVKTIIVAPTNIVDPFRFECFEIFKNVGDIVNKNDEIILFDWDKIEWSIYAPHSGKIIEMFVNEGELVPENGKLFVMDCDLRSHVGSKN